MDRTLRNWLPRSANILLLLGLAWLSYQLVLQLLPQDQHQPALTVSIPATEKVTKTGIPPDRLADWHLFGESVDPGESDASFEPPTTAPDTNLDLLLKGIVATHDKTQGYAIIQKPDKQEKHFKVGGNVFGLATLEEIYVDRVILQRNGRYETLRLPVEFMSEDPALERLRKKKIERIVTDFRDAFLSSDVSELMELFEFDTAYKNGGFIGFVVKALGERGREMMATLGVEEGDLITVVNGMRLSESLEAVDRLKDLKNAASVDFIIERNGAEIPFHFDFELPEGASVSDDGQIIHNTASGAATGGNAAGSAARSVTATGSKAGVTGASERNSSDSEESDDGVDSEYSSDESGLDEADEDLGEDYGSTEEEQAFIEMQKARRTNVNKEVEFDH